VLPTSDDRFLLEDYDSDGEKAALSKNMDFDLPSDKSPYSSHAASTSGTSDPFNPHSKEEEELKEFPTRKIFFCSRTHSQLSQFIQEIRKTHWANDLRLVILGSRKTMCINPSVNQLPSVNQINDKCLDLVTSKASSLSSGPESSLSVHSRSIATELNDSFGLVPQETQTSMCRFLHDQRQHIFRDHILAAPKDIEELLEVGKKGIECPYFATRAAVQNAELVVLPYNTLLHQSTREALGIDLRGSIVILDEAHNLIDTVNAIHSVELTLSKMGQALSQLNAYMERFRTRLKLRNVSYIEKIQAILRSLIKYLDPPTQNSAESESGTSSPKIQTDQAHLKPTMDQDDSGVNATIVSLNDFLFDAHLDQFNLYKIERYLKDSDIIHKVQGFCQTTQIEISVVKSKRTIQIQLDETEFEKHRPALGMVAQFLMTLTSKASDGRLLVSRHRAPSNPKQSSFKYILMNPETQFQAIWRDARAVILAGGTMQPFGDFYQHLLSDSLSTSVPSRPTGSNEVKASTIEKPVSRVVTFTCSHIIPDSNLLTVIFPSGPSGVEFNFTHDNRHRNNEMFDEASALLLNLCNVVPDGIVIFSPSYRFEESLIARWKANGNLEAIESKKTVFREPRSASNVESVLSEYESCINKNTGLPGAPTGAILSCVVGGKLSEGINFKDHLGRCVVILGLPFPNAKDPILMERLAHVQLKANASKTQGPESTNAANSAEYYENLCMKAVNQSIGRSIRHIGDYATIILVDQRYRSKPSIQAKLPQWIRNRLAENASGGFGEGFKSVVQFFRSKSANQTAIQEARRNTQI
jgi:chromosome transmission fidelity protein 1